MKQVDWYVTKDQKYLLCTIDATKTLYIADPRGGRKKVLAIEGDEATYLIRVKEADKNG